MNDMLFGGIIGLVVGDAMGVPVEFMSRESLRQNPVTDMREFGTHNQPKGTWSDDSTMTLCLMESLIHGLDYSDICAKFLAWTKSGYMTAHGNLFDIGIATQSAIERFSQNTPPLECGGNGEYDNGNGSLMRILPIAFYTMGMTVNEKFEITHNVSALTHAHMRSKIACSIYVQFACELLKGYSKEKALKQTIHLIQDNYKNNNELSAYDRIIKGDIASLSEDQTHSSGYVVHSLEAALWCLFTTQCYKDCILKAVNLGEDTDTVGAIAGGLAGILYGIDEIPGEWVDAIVKIDKIRELCTAFSKVYKPFDEFYKFIPMLIEKPKMAGLYNYDPRVISYMKMPYELGYMDYDYFETLGRYGVNESNVELRDAIKTANIELLLAINTYYLRRDRFCESTLDDCVQDETFLNIVNRFKEIENGA